MASKRELSAADKERAEQLARPGALICGQSRTCLSATWPWVDDQLTPRRAGLPRRLCPHCTDTKRWKEPPPATAREAVLGDGRGVDWCFAQKKPSRAKGEKWRVLLRCGRCQFTLRIVRGSKIPPADLEQIGA